MSSENDSLNRFSSAVRQLIHRFSDLKKENGELLVAIEERDKKISELEQKLTQAHHDYNSLKMARMVEVTDGDVEAAKKRIAGLIREVNKCITLLNEQ
ncbi:MAG: hypothetical protein IJ549_08115 [Prevotella sp.]|nr:hypothetical protein [Prevotella sp.]MBQ8701185.1 hypothetical protein [Prevotella sp.]MBQ8702707.1 hypothetical protein [Prevotella sp.]MBQ9651531.1 hypothetical protein [Prevotella sp.]